MIRMVLIWTLLVAAALACGHQFTLVTAIGVWAVIVAGLCGLGSLLIARQSLGRATTTGMIGSAVVRYGYRVGQGMLPAAAAISWIVWTAVGTAAIAAFHSRSDLSSVLLLVSWLINGLALMYLIGTLILASRGGRVPKSIVKVSLMLAAILAGSVILNAIGTPWSQRTALTLAGAPIVLIGGGYGLFILVILTFGRNARWN
ncbi:hypothetical protein [Humisphaera borealis]|uniref:Uncharacterized protein n=1 Tax=Humisphaera borealis TaxID=2807512 RepID=A0A7M2X491_9BACT|nr:hypothetical protein [Humisphaera borealis]QOV91580.1 hypothetical protein IPV69_09555 [Humisphaera borealis]